VSAISIFQRTDAVRTDAFEHLPGGTGTVRVHLSNLSTDKATTDSVVEDHVNAFTHAVSSSSTGTFEILVNGEHCGLRHLLAVDMVHRLLQDKRLLALQPQCAAIKIQNPNMTTKAVYSFAKALNSAVCEKVVLV